MVLVAGVVVGVGVVVAGACVVAGAEAAACAGGITAFTTGFTHLFGITTAVATPPIMTIFKTCRRFSPAPLPSIISLSCVKDFVVRIRSRAAMPANSITCGNLQPFQQPAR